MPARSPRRGSRRFGTTWVVGRFLYIHGYSTAARAVGGSAADLAPGDIPLFFLTLYSIVKLATRCEREKRRILKFITHDCARGAPPQRVLRLPRALRQLVLGDELARRRRHLVGGAHLQSAERTAATAADNPRREARAHALRGGGGGVCVARVQRGELAGEGLRLQLGLSERRSERRGRGAQLRPETRDAAAAAAAAARRRRLLARGCVAREFRCCASQGTQPAPPSATGGGARS